MGLSPRVRGNHRCDERLILRRGSIPACAGEPTCSSNGTSGARVYPRVCGGTRGCARQLPCGGGLSPRVRGNRATGAPAISPAGSIPACAGEPSDAWGHHRHDEVYPRVCGGTSWPVSRPPGWKGLSPRVRGNHGVRREIDRGLRSIPACAGEPSARPRSDAMSWVYPRVCGGTPPGAIWGTRPRGLSPRVRGNHGKHLGGLQLGRSIPACAGEPMTPFLRLHNL